MKSRSLSRPAAAVLVVAALAACGELTGSLRLTTLFTTQPLTGQVAPGFIATSNVPGTLDIVGSFGVRGCPTSEHARADRSGSTVTFRVSVTSTQGTTCPDSVSYTAYQARVAGLKGQTYHLRIEHYGTADSSSTGTLPAGLRYQQDVRIR
jgi:hypothetical protein